MLIRKSIVAGATALFLMGIIAGSATGIPIARAGKHKPKVDDSTPADVSKRGLTIVYAATQPAAIHDAADRIAKSVATSPLLKVLAGSETPEVVSSTDFAKASPTERAFQNIVLVGLPDDPIIGEAWLKDARLIAPAGSGVAGKDASGLYVFGFGNLLGDIGYIESGRNPFLHSEVIPKTPYETEIVTVSGSSLAGVALAVNALLNQGIINGVVAGNFHRGEKTLLDRDPLKPGVGAVAAVGGTGAAGSLPMQIGDWKCIGITQAGEDEYRGVLADTGVEPAVIWREKFYQPGVWDLGGEDHSLKAFSDGLHRRSYGDTLWAAQFESPSAASAAALEIAKSAHLNKTRDHWTGKQGPLGPEKESAGPLSLEVKGSWVLMSTVPAEL